MFSLKDVDDDGLSNILVSISKKNDVEKFLFGEKYPKEQKRNHNGPHCALLALP